MLNYIIRRLLLIIPTFILVTIIVFFSVRFIPGDVIELMVAEMGAEATVAERQLTIEHIKAKLGMDAPIHIQYARFLGIIPNPLRDNRFSGLLQGDLGDSLWTGRAVSEEVLSRLPVSIELGLLAIFIAVIEAIPIGVYSAIRQDTAGDYIGRTIAILFLSLPPFWIGTMVIVFPSVWWGWMPPVEVIPIFKDFAGNMAQYLLPAVILGMFMSGATMRMMRTMMLEVMRQDYIRTAWSKGLGERTVITRHALKNALIPVITILGIQVPMVVGGSAVVEVIFCLPGVGRLLVEALYKRDYPIISGINVVLASFVVIANLLVDLWYGWLDPRVVYK